MSAQLLQLVCPGNARNTHSTRTPEPQEKHTRHHNTRTARASLAGAVGEPRVQHLLRLPVVVPPHAVQGAEAGAVLAAGHLPSAVFLQG